MMKDEDMNAEQPITPHPEAAIAPSVPVGIGAYLQELRPLISLAVPLVAGLVTSTLMGIIDTYMLGSRGETVLAAVSLTSSVLLIFYAALYGFLGPVSVLVGQAFGAANSSKIGTIIQHGLVIGGLAGVGSSLLMLIALFGILPHTGQPAEVMAIISPYWIAMSLALIPYCVSLVYKQLYDAIDRPWMGFALTLVPVTLNIVLNTLLIPSLGLAGAGLASMTAQFAGMIFMTIHFRLIPMTRPFRGVSRWSLVAFREQLREGIPMSIQYLAEGGAVALAGILIGWLGTTALAANQIVFSVTSVLYMLPLGMAGAVGIRVAQAAGGAEADRIRPISYTALALVSGWAALFTLVLLLGGNQIADFFVDERDVILAATGAFVAVGVMQIFDGLQSVSLGALRGLLDTRWPTRVSLIGYWLIALPAGYVMGFTLQLGVAGFWGGFALGLLVAAFMLLRRLHGKTGIEAVSSV
jgi:multidrug resistance protein, MATE family